MSRRFSRVEQGVESLAAGRVIIVVDSEDRENEGDFVAAAESITPETIYFMAQQGCGQLCVPVLPDVAERLELTPMVPHNLDPTAPRFTIPIDHRTCASGISPLERAVSIQFMLDEESRAEDFLKPGHIFPLIARPEGVLQRTGHTEAAVDLARLAGLTPAGVLCEVCSRDRRRMATRDELFEIADEFNLVVITIDDLVDLRRSESHSFVSQLPLARV